MTWICPQCLLTNVNYNKHCADSKCKTERIQYFEPFDNFDELLSKVRFSRIDKAISLYLSQNWRTNPVTLQEELFSQLFNHEKVLVKDMEILELRAHREELAKIAFEARARLTAVDDEENDRKKKKVSDGKPKGFERNLNIDAESTGAINAIKDRQKKLTGKEKMLDGLVKLYMKGGMSSLEAEKIANSAMGAGAILARVKDDKSKKLITNPSIRSPFSQSDGFVIKPSEPIESKPIINPFTKKEQ